jgi:4-amino-4-deoxy-L-arabinose transferase-like glycosyltransferase
VPRARQLVATYWLAIPALVIVALFALRALLVTPPLDNLRVVESDPRDPPGTVARAGSLYIARGGPVVVSLQSMTPARLTIADKDMVGLANRERIVLPEGPVAIRFASPPSGRLVWNPVGRRGDFEYVSASSLSPEPPDRATFPAWAGAAPLDGVIASLLLLTLVATLLWLARHRLRRVPRNTWLAMGTIVAAACIVRWISLSSFGQTWDEDVNWSSGRNYITNVLALDGSILSWIWNFQHPPVMKYLAGIGAQFADGYGPARALSAVWVALGCAFLVPIGARLYSFRAGVLAALIAALLPPLVAHGQIVGHEAPTVLWWSLGILLALTVHDDDPSTRTLRTRLVAVGVVIGIAIASRFVNGLLGILCLAIVVERAPAARRIASAIDGAVIMPIAAAITFYAVWPRIWARPIASLETSLEKLTQTHTPEPFLGTVTATPGPHYFLVYLLATLPLLILVGVAAYLVRAAKERNRAALVVAAWFLIPLAVVASPVRQDGVRYVMPCIIALALASAVGWDFVVRFAERRVARLRRMFAIATSALALYLAITLAVIHPYYLDYFGEHVGGAGTVARKGLAETAWWGEGLDRAVDYVNEHAAPNARVYRNCIEPVHLAWFRHDLWAPMTNNINETTWIVTYAPQSRPCPIPANAKRVFTVTAQGATLAEAWMKP